MFLIGRMRLPAFFVPYIEVYGGEKGICLGSFGSDFRQAEPVGYRHGLLIDACTANDVDLFVATATLQGGFEGREEFCSGALGSGIGREDDVAPVGQGTFGQ